MSDRNINPCEYEDSHKKPCPNEAKRFYRPTKTRYCEFHYFLAEIGELNIKDDLKVEEEYNKLEKEKKEMEENIKKEELKKNASS